MAAIRIALFKWMGIKDSPNKTAAKANNVTPGMPRFSVTSGAMKAWRKAGMPEPSAFFSKYMKDHKHA